MSQNENLSSANCIEELNPILQPPNQNLSLAKMEKSSDKQFNDLKSNPKNLMISWFGRTSNHASVIIYLSYQGERSGVGGENMDMDEQTAVQKSDCESVSFASNCGLVNEMLAFTHSGGKIAILISEEIKQDVGAFQGIQLSYNNCLKMWFKKKPCGSESYPMISKDDAFGVGDTKNDFYLVVGNILLDYQDFTSLLSMKRKSSSLDCHLSLLMEMITRYDFHRVSSLFYSWIPRKRSTEVINTSCLGVCNILDVGVIPSVTDDILIDILSRLPVKSLMRFKSVSKHWLSLIKHDQHLSNLHFNHSKSRPNLLYMNPLYQKGLRGVCTTWLEPCFGASKTLRQSISCAEIVEGSGGEGEVEAITRKVRITDDKWFPYNQVLGPVNGFVCFVDTETYAVRVYNVSTREATPWVKSTLLAEEKDKLKSENNKLEMTTHCPPIYQFGFDPVKKEYKVFCFWRLSARPQNYRRRLMERHNYARWEVLTVGHDTKWRKINMVPNEKNKTVINEMISPYDRFATQPVYADGTLYWCNKMYCSSAPWDDDPDVVVALDVGSEKFRVVSIPNFIRNEPREQPYTLPTGMLILGGRVALLYRMESFVVKLWMLDDGADKRLENCQGSESNWSSETIQLPFFCDQRIRGFGVAGSNDETIIFDCHQLIMEAGLSEDFVSLYSYNRRKKSLKKIEMDGDSLFPLYSSRSLVASFTESLYSIVT